MRIGAYLNFLIIWVSGESEMNIWKFMSASVFLFALHLLSGCTDASSRDSIDPGLLTRDVINSGSSIARHAETKQFSTPIPASSSQPSETPFVAMTSTRVVPVYPTASKQEEEMIVNLLSNEDCILPCYLDITPGQTTKDQAELIMTRIGAIYSGGHLFEGMENKRFLSYIGDETLLKVTNVPSSIRGANEIYQEITITFAENIVQKIVVRINTRRLVDKFERYWSNYSLTEVFNELGIPDRISMPFLNERYRIIIIYERFGVVLGRTDSLENSMICPLSESNSIDMSLYITDPLSSLGIFDLPIQRPTNYLDLNPIDDVLGIDEKLFYDRIISEPDPCFQPLIEP